jgi:hypothetical protein
VLALIERAGTVHSGNATRTQRGLWEVQLDRGAKLLRELCSVGAGELRGWADEVVLLHAFRAVRSRDPELSRRPWPAQTGCAV